MTPSSITWTDPAWVDDETGDMDKRGYSVFFNEKLKGRYAWWIGLKYAVPIDEEEGMGVSGYTACEQEHSRLTDPSSVYHTYYISTYTQYDLISGFVDMTETDAVNSISKILSSNEYITDPDITIDDLKLFRRWLAAALLRMDQDSAGDQMNKDYTPEVTHMLEYYKADMADDTVKWLSKFGSSSVSVISSSSAPAHSCGCSSTTNISSLYGSSLASCDALYIYMKNIQSLMVQTFSSINFWITRREESKEFIAEFKKYIDNILSLDLPLSTDITSQTSSLLSCSCSQKNRSGVGRDILMRLSESLGYIYDNDTTGHKNYISDAFSDWAAYLYESMFWV